MGRLLCYIKEHELGKMSYRKNKQYNNTLIPTYVVQKNIKYDKNVTCKYLNDNSSQ